MHQSQHPIQQKCIKLHRLQLNQRVCQSCKRQLLIRRRKVFRQLCPYNHQNHHHRATNVELQSRKQYTKIRCRCVSHFLCPFCFTYISHQCFCCCFCFDCLLQANIQEKYEIVTQSLEIVFTFKIEWIVFRILYPWIELFYLFSFYFQIPVSFASFLFDWIVNKTLTIKSVLDQSVPLNITELSEFLNKIDCQIIVREVNKIQLWICRALMTQPIQSPH